MATLHGSSPLAFPHAPERVPDAALRTGRYEVRFARTEAELDAIQRLRYEVFNVELGEGFEASHETGRDSDVFDLTCHHLLVVDTTTDVIVGTYRLQTGEMAATGAGFYSAGEFDLSGLPDHVRDHGVELGRACIAAEHRKQRVLFGLWKGMAAYLAHNRKTFLFGCCSLTSQDPMDGALALAHLERAGHLQPGLPVRPLPGLECEAEGPLDEDRVAAVRIPPLFSTYLRYRAKVWSPPAIDRLFKTLDFFVVCDIHDNDPETLAVFFDGEPPSR